MSCGDEANLSDLDSGVVDAELVKRWTGDVDIWCLPGYGVPLALILVEERYIFYIFQTTSQRKTF